MNVRRRILLLCEFLFIGSNTQFSCVRISNFIYNLKTIMKDVYRHRLYRCYFHPSEHNITNISKKLVVFNTKCKNIRIFCFQISFSSRNENRREIFEFFSNKKKTGQKKIETWLSTNLCELDLKKKPSETQIFRFFVQQRFLTDSLTV